MSVTGSPAADHAPINAGRGRSIPDRWTASLFACSHRLAIDPARTEHDNRFGNLAKRLEFCHRSTGQNRLTEGDRRDLPRKSAAMVVDFADLRADQRSGSSRKLSGSRPRRNFASQGVVPAHDDECFRSAKGPPSLARICRRASAGDRRGDGRGGAGVSQRREAGTRKQRLTRAAYDAANQLWDEHGPANYDLDIEVTGNRPGKIHVEVRDRQATHMVRDGVEPRQQRTWYYWTVPGMLDTIGQELDKVDDPATGFGAPPGSEVILRAQFDERLGYPQLLARRGGPEPRHGIHGHPLRSGEAGRRRRTRGQRAITYLTHRG